MNGWGVRPYNWEFSAGIQREILPRLSVLFAYFRRINGNFFVMDNEALGRNDFTQYSVTVPSIPGFPALPNAGRTITGVYDPNSNPVARNVVKAASQFGKQQQHWDGIDLTVDARLRNGLFLQGGVSTGKTMTDYCDIVDDVPEALLGTGQTGVPSPLTATPGVWTPASFCHQESPYLPQYKGLASYTLPWYDIRVSGTFQSLPGPLVAANNIYAEAGRAAATTLSRPFTLAQSNVNVIEPGTFYGDRLNQIDLRFTKILRVGNGSVDLNVDFYNAFNSDAVTFELAGYGPVWRLPLTVIQPRFVKFMARWDF
jgi:hypothetical protein